jgi:hypothetical protein
LQMNFAQLQHHQHLLLHLFLYHFLSTVYGGPYIVLLIHLLLMVFLSVKVHWLLCENTLAW